MRDVENGKRKLPVNPGKVRENPPLQRDVETGKRFVQEKESGPGAERAPDRDAATLASGKGQWFSRQKMRDFQNGDHLIESPLPSVLQILPNREMGKKRVPLRNKSNSSLMRRQRRQILSS
jgi:hypothetical protein|tara:strand:+ start:206 stop:568 length:363 start_codon:yes stop_codon:yes gene_type:complete